MQDFLIPPQPNSRLKVKRSLKGWLGRAFLAILVITISVFLLRWLFPLWVGYSPISRFALWNKMEAAYGEQTMEDMLNEKLLTQAFARHNIKVDESAVDQQLQLLETQFEKVGGLELMLAKRGMTKDELRKQIVTQLSVEQLLQDEVEPSEEEVKAEYESNQETTYLDQDYESVAEDIKKKLRADKLGQALNKWMEEARQSKSIVNFGL